MPILTFRVSIPAATHAVAPLSIDLISQARAIDEVIVFAMNIATLDISKCGYRLYDRGSSKQIIPDVGSQDNGIMANPGEAWWAPIPLSALRLKLYDRVIEGPPYKLTVAFFNETAAALQVAGFLVVKEPFINIDAAMMYELLTKGAPPRDFQADTAQGLPMERAKAKD